MPIETKEASGDGVVAGAYNSSLSNEGGSTMLLEHQPMEDILPDIPSFDYVPIIEQASEEGARISNWFSDNLYDAENVKSMFELLRVALENAAEMKHFPSREMEWARRAAAGTRAIIDDLVAYGVQDIPELYDIETKLSCRAKQLEAVQVESRGRG